MFHYHFLSPAKNSDGIQAHFNENSVTEAKEFLHCHLLHFNVNSALAATWYFVNSDLLPFHSIGVFL